MSTCPAAALSLAATLATAVTAITALISPTSPTASFTTVAAAVSPYATRGLWTFCPPLL